MQPDVGAAATDLVGGFGKELAHGGGQFAQVGQWGGGGQQLGQLGEAGGLGRVGGGLLLAEFGSFHQGEGLNCRVW